MKLAKIEKKENFDRSLAEEAMDRFFTDKIGGPMGTLVSDVPGVIAMPRLSGYDTDKVDWNEFACRVARETGYTILAVANCDWEQEDDCDEEATYVSFQIPSLPENYRDDEWRNNIDGPIGPDMASEEDFAAYRKAETYGKARLRELKAKLGYAQDFERDATQLEVDQLDAILPVVRAWHRDAVAALNNRDVAGAHGVISAELDDAPAPTTPRA